MKRKRPLVAIQCERNRAHGRGVLEGIADYQLTRTDWQVELVESEDLLRPEVVGRFDGLIVRVMNDETSDALVASGKPVVDTYGRRDDNPLSSIRLDDAAIGELAADFFAARYFKACAFCGFPGIRFSIARGAAFSARVLRHGGTCAVYAGTAAGRYRDVFFRNEKVADIADADSLFAWAKGLPKPVAVFCCNDIRALQLERVCLQGGLNLDGRLSVLGVDNDIVLCTFAKPSISSVNTDPVALGREAAGMLDELMRRKGRRRVLTALHRPVGVVERMSTDLYPFKTPWLSEAVGYIRRHLAEGVSAKTVVAHIGYSHPVVGKAFRDELGHTVQQEIIRQRRLLACRLLEETDLSAADIALRCGYPTVQYFFHRFALAFKTTPERWRQARKAERLRGLATAVS